MWLVVSQKKNNYRKDRKERKEIVLSQRHEAHKEYFQIKNSEALGDL